MQKVPQKDQQPDNRTVYIQGVGDEYLYLGGLIVNILVENGGVNH
jgi:hypothetical protein